MNKKFLWIGGALLLIFALGVLAWWISRPEVKQTASENTHRETQDQTQDTTFSFENPKKSPHYETNTPNHSSVLSGVPINVVIDFNFDVVKPSEIKILKDGEDLGDGETTIDNNKLVLRRAMKTDAPDGLYTVSYKACWPDTSCHDGNFQFAINRALARGFLDETGKNEVKITLSSFAFDKQNIRISKGTRVTWVNAESSQHYINSDSHPAHTYFPAQNSKALSKGDSFSLVFDQAGVYPYHCSAHPDTMTGNLLVE